MARYTTSGTKTTIGALNTELEKIAVAQEDFVSRVGETPNQMEGNLDMNSNRILNLPEPVDPTDAVRLQDITENNEVAEQSGQAGKFLSTNGTNTLWAVPPTGGGTGGTANFNDRLNEVIARMAAGEVTSLAFYGDSTTDGFGTTGWIANPTDGSGDATGTIDQNTGGGANAYSRVLQDLLREIYNNNAISTYNAGYSGKRMDDGWAVANYQKAVIDNPFYGVPDVTVIAFGLNDISIAGSQINDFLAQSRLLIARIIADGTLPVLMTADAMFRNGDTNDTRDHKEAVRQLDEIQRFLAKEYNIPIFEMGDALKDWAQNNSDRMGWVQMQPDALHFEDKGHIFKAGFLGTQFFKDYVYHTAATDQYIATPNSATAYSGNSTYYKFSNNQQGGNVYYSSSAPADATVVNMWVWNESPKANLVYLGIDDESQGLDGTDLPLYTTEAKISVNSKMLETTTEKTIISAGGFSAISSLRRSDEHYIFGKLSYGWNNVKYITGDSPSSFFGGFRIMNGELKPFVSPISTPMFGTYTASSGVYITQNPEDGLDTIAGGFLGDTITIAVDFDADAEGGVLALHGQGFNTNQSGVDSNRQNAVLLMRHISGELRVYSVAWSKDNNTDVTFSSRAASAVLPWSTPNFKGRLELTKVGQQQQIRVYDAYEGGSLVIDALVNGPQSVRWSGIGGGIFFNSDLNAVGGSVSLNEMFFIR
jgi:lysophospholipase L1-like esterase